MLESDARNLVVSTAQSWIGLNGCDGSKREILDIYNRIRPLPRGYRVPMNQPWCAATVSALASVTGTLDIIPAECSCYYMVEALKKMGAWVENDHYHPKPGDIIFYDWDDTGRGDNRGVPDHVGVVECVRGDRITVIEGNKGNAVDRRHIYVGGWGIRGYGTPDYHTHAINESVDKLSMLKVIDSPAYWKRECILGTVRWLPELIGKASNVIKRYGPRCGSVGEALDRLVNAGVINTPTYWANVWPGNRNIYFLLKALGGCV